MENKSVEEIIRIRTENRLTQKQGVDFLREYRKHPEMFLPLIDHQYGSVGRAHRSMCTAWQKTPKSTCPVLAPERRL